MSTDNPPFQKISGTRDIYGPEALLWESIEKTARDIFHRFGFEPIRTPVIEPPALFKQSVGEETDLVKKEMYSFAKSDTQIALRPEGTASIVRAIIENNLLNEKRVRKLYYYGPMFRAERPQAGRQRQFNQIGAEIFGSNSPVADAELIEMLCVLLNALKISGYGVHVNNIGDFETRKNYAGALRASLMNRKSDLCADCRLRLEKNPLRVLDCKVPACQPILNDVPGISQYASSRSTDHFQNLLAALQKLDIPHKHDNRIVRGLDYYTDTVFEVKHYGLGAQNALAAGGRYNNLVQQLGGSEVPATGFALGVERLVMLVKKQSDNLEEQSAGNENSVVVVWHGELLRTTAYMILSRLRQLGIRCFMDFDGHSMKSQMRQANKENVGWVIVVGEQEAHNKSIKLKNMKVGREDEIKEDEFFNHAHEYLKAAHA